MKRTMYNFLIIGLLLLGHSQAISSHFDEDIVPDLKSLLANSSIPKTDGESLEAELIRSYVHAHKPNMKFFSHPEKFHDHWKEFLGKHDRQPIVKEIFLVMGRLHRAVLSNGQKEYYDFADALNQGMARIVQGDLGFRKSSMQEDEKDIFAKELLVSGRSLASNVWNSTDQLGFHYILASDLKEKRHLQISALLMLAGHDRTLIDDSGWYLKDVSEADKERLLAWVYDSADCLLPARFKAGSMDAQIEEYANSVEFLKAFEVRQKQQLKDALRKGVSWHIANENGGNFPDREYLARAETFFENLKGEHRYHTDFYNIQALSNIINLIFKGKKLPDWDQFLTFPNRLIGNGDSLGKSTNFVVYTHFPDELKRKDFVEFSRNYMRNTKILIHNLEETENLVLAYESFDDELQRTAFMEFCKPYIEQARTSELIEILMPVYKSLSGTPGKIESFQEFCKPYLEGIGKLALEDLIEIYQAFKEEGERTVFMSTTYHWFHDVTPQTPGMLKAYLPFYRKDDRSRSFYKNWEPVFKATKQKHRDGLRGVILALQKIDRHLENEEERQSFIALFDKVKGNDSFLYRYGMKTLLSRIEKAYQVFTDQEKRERFLILEVDYGGGSPSTPEYLIRYVGH